MPSPKKRLCRQCGEKCINKFCSKQCYFKYKTEHRMEYEPTYSAMRSKLKTTEDLVCENCGAVCRRRWRTRFCSVKCFSEYRIKHPEEFLVDTKSRQDGYAKFSKKEQYKQWLLNNAERMKTNNPMHKKNVVQKVTASCKKYWDEHPQEKEARIKRFMQAPLRCRGKEWKPTSLEMKILELGIDSLRYVGDGSLFITIGPIGGKRKKNPDFLLPHKKKVIEVGHTYWHPEHEIQQTIFDYNCIGYQCLYLTEVDLVDRSVYEKIVREFCSN